MNRDRQRVSNRLRVSKLVRPGQAIYAAMLLVLVATVGTSQTPTISSPQSPVSGVSGVPIPATAADLVNRVGAAGDMIGFSNSDGSGTQTITLVHTGKSWMAVYHIDRSGMVRLVSSRPIDADFSLQLNATSPLPEEIRQLGTPPG